MYGDGTMPPGMPMPPMPGMPPGMNMTVGNNSNIHPHHLGSLFLRLSWHSSGTYDANLKIGGSMYGSVGFQPEISYANNAGLTLAINALNPLLSQYSFLSCGDLYTLAGVVASEFLGGPEIAWRPGRQCLGTVMDSSMNMNGMPPMKMNGEPSPDNLPSPHINNDTAPHNDTMGQVYTIFARMGFNERETVALLGGHSLGMCHFDLSGYQGLWSNTDLRLDNKFYKMLVYESYNYVGPNAFHYNTKPQYASQKQYIKTDSYMMLPSDMGFLWNARYAQYVQLYANDLETWQTDFAAAYSKLLELGVNFNAKAQQKSPAAATAPLTILSTFGLLMLALILL